jgi:hypothetical protein
VGSARWLAPETTAETPEFSEKSDVFALGMVLWEIAAREIPFAKVVQEVQVIYLIKYEKRRPQIPADCPKLVAEAIEKCWQQLPSERPTAEEILNLLENGTFPSSPSRLTTPSKSNSKSKYYIYLLIIDYRF